MTTVVPEATRTCPECGGPVALVETRHDEGGAPGEPTLVYACTTAGCGGHVEAVDDQEATAANEPTGGEGIGA